MVKKNSCLLGSRIFFEAANFATWSNLQALGIIMAVGDPVIGWQYINENLNFEKNTKGGSVSLEGRL